MEVNQAPLRLLHSRGGRLMHRIPIRRAFRWRMYQWCDSGLLTCSPQSALTHWSARLHAEPI
jgi:hypothetical protein